MAPIVIVPHLSKRRCPPSRRVLPIPTLPTGKSCERDETRRLRLLPSAVVAQALMVSSLSSSVKNAWGIYSDYDVHVLDVHVRSHNRLCTKLHISAGAGERVSRRSSEWTARAGTKKQHNISYIDSFCLQSNNQIRFSRVHLRQQMDRKTAGSWSPQSYSNAGSGNDNNSNESPPTSQTVATAAASPSFAKLQLEGQDEILDVVACSAPAGLFELRSERHSHVILASGVSPALAFYPIGSESRSFGLASIAWAVASRVTSLTVGALDGLFGFVGLRGRGRKAAAARSGTRSGERGGGGEGGNGGGRVGEDEGSPAPLVLRWDGGLQDGWRRVSRLYLDPSGRLAAAADGFGRVMLVDCATRQVRYLRFVRICVCVCVCFKWLG